MLFAFEKKRHKVAWLAIKSFFISLVLVQLQYYWSCFVHHQVSPPSSDHLLVSGTVTETSTLREEELVSMSSLSLSDPLLLPSDSGDEGSGDPDDDSSSWLPRWFWYSLGSILRMYGITLSIWMLPIKPEKKRSSKVSECRDRSGESWSRSLGNRFLSPGCLWRVASSSSATALSWSFSTQWWSEQRR